MNDLEKKINFLADFLTEERKEKMEDILEKRTDQLTIVLEDVYYAQNISATLRTAECFGVQDIHIIEEIHDYQVNPRIVRGASKWLSIHRYNRELQEHPTKHCISELKNQGFKVVATAPDAEAISLYDLPVDQKYAFIFGTELTGVSRSAAELADDYVAIPMSGFTESFNISVSVALVLQHMYKERRSLGLPNGLDNNRKLEIRYDWYRRSVKHSDQLLDRYFAS